MKELERAGSRWRITHRQAGILKPGGSTTLFAGVHSRERMPSGSRSRERKQRYGAAEGPVMVES